MLIRWLKRWLSKEIVLIALCIVSTSIANVGLSGVSLVRNQITERITSQSKDLLAADLAITSRMPISNDTLKPVFEVFKNELGTIPLQSKLIEFYSMVRAQKQTRLTEIFAIDSFYPFYGSLKSNSSPSEDLHQESPVIWVSNEFSELFKVNLNDQIQLGQMKFKIIRVLDPGETRMTRIMSLAPRVFIDQKHLNQIGLITEGSLTTTRILFHLPEVSTDKLRKLKKQVIQSLNQSSIRVQTHFDAADQIARAMTLITPYMSLVSLFGWLLALISLTYLVQMLIQRDLSSWITARALGIPAKKIIFYYVMFLLGFAFMTGSLSILGTFVGTGILSKKMTLFSELIPKQFDTPILTLRFYFIPFLFSFLGSITTLLRLLKINPTQILQDSSSLPKLSRTELISVSIIFIATWVSILWIESRSWVLSFVVILLFLGCTLLIPKILFGVLKKIRNRSPFVKSLTYYTNETRLMVAVISLTSALFFTLIGIERWLNQEFLDPNQSSLPRFFIFDIQDEQVQTFQAWSEKINAPILNLSPLIQARLKSINQNPVTQKSESGFFLTQEEEREENSRNRTFNLTIRDQPLSSETVLQKLEPDPSAKALYGSFETRFMKRLKLKLGDSLEFDVQGLTIPIQVREVRKVRWTSFQPNFFISTRSGSILDQAPKSWLASVNPTSDRTQYQNQLQDQFKNFSVIDVEQVSRQLNELFSQLALGIKAITFMVLVLSLISLISLSLERKDRNQGLGDALFIIGCPAQLFKRWNQNAFRLVGLCSLFLSFLFSLGLNQMISKTLFEGQWIWPNLIELSFMLLYILLTEIILQVPYFRKTNR